MKKLSILIAAAMLTASASAEVKLPNYFGENMVMQQNHAMSIPAKARPNAEVKITPSWTGKTVKTRTDAAGNFTINLTAPAAGGPFAITFDDGDVTTVGNLLSGEVWLCSGQSNMEFPINGWGSVIDNETLIAKSNKPTIRLFQVRKAMAFSPQEDVEVNMGGWVESNPATMYNFSAIAYLYACQLSDSLNIPIGVIDTSWGGTPAEAWTSFEGVASVPGFEREVKMLVDNNFDRDSMRADYEKQLNQWMELTNKDAASFDKAVYQTAWKSIQEPTYIDQNELPGLDGITWYQKQFEIPAAWEGQDMHISFGPIDDEDVVYLNGVEIGRGSGYKTPRHYTVPGTMVKAGPAVITIRNADFGGEGGFAGKPDDMYASAAGGRIDLDGEWKYLVGADFRELPAKPVDINGPNFPTVLYNAMLYPLHNLPVKGYLWYQGCANVGRDEQYAPLMKRMVNDWRKDWGEDNSFYFVQLAGFLNPQYCQSESNWAALRNAQLAVLDLDNTGVAVAIDLGHPTDIHPRNKQDVAARLARIALARDYGHDVEYKAPAVESVKISGDKMVLKFDAPLRTVNPAMLGFIMGDKDGNWAQASGRYVDDCTVEISAPGIKKPVAARYDWADCPNGNLYGANGLPVVPFATDK